MTNGVYCAQLKDLRADICAKDSNQVLRGIVLLQTL